MAGTPILCYHKVGSLDRSLNVAEEDFRKQVAFLRRRRYRFGVLGDFSGLPSRSVILTFDDVYMTTAECLLRQEGLVGTLFPVPAYVGGGSDWDGEKARPLADWDAIKELARAGFEIGNHTSSHADLSLAETAVDAELREAHEQLSERFGTVKSCAYPYGRYDARATESLRDMEYAAAVTTVTGVASPLHPPLELPRLMIAYSDRVAGLMYKMYLRPLLGK